MEELTAVLFSGGKGSRLYPYTDHYQKVMLPIGQCGLPLLEIILTHLKSFKIKKFLILVNYRANQIKQYFGDGSWLGVDIKYQLDEPGFKGTANALLNARSMISTTNFLVYYTDILSSINISKFYQFHRNHSTIGSIWIDTTWESPVHLVTLGRKNQIVEMSLSSQSLNANTGIAMFSNRVFDVLEIFYQDQKGHFDISEDIFPYLVNNNELKAYNATDWWLDIGNIRRHKLVTDELIERRFPHLSLITENEA